MPRRTPDVDELLENWEQVYKKGLLSFWILLLLHERAGYAYETSAAIAEMSQGTISVDENSIYRALNRFEAMGIVASEARQSPVGPPRRYYRLTPAGQALLARFIQRNVLIFTVPAVAERIQAALDGASRRPEDRP
jgi:PadR family transcriptional regulator PadR